MAEKNYITQKGIDRLLKELNQLIHVERPEVTKVIAWAASNGDRSENADYIYGKKKLREIDRRARFLGKRVKAAIVVNPLEILSDRIKFGATVEMENCENGEIKVVSIVGVDEIDSSKGYISWKSPIGRSLLNKEEGDFVEVRAPAGTIEYEICRVQYIELD